jgi:hypothetical protein
MESSWNHHGIIIMESSSSSSSVRSSRGGKLAGTPNFAVQARELMLRWSLISSLVIRDLTLRSAASFGMCHLLRLLCDEYGNTSPQASMPKKENKRKDIF